MVNPALRQVSTRLSLSVASSAASRQGVERGRSSGPREIGRCGRATCHRLRSPRAGAGAGGRPTSVNESIRPG